MENTHRFWIRGLALVLTLLCPAAPAWAISVVVDLDPVMAGIQTTLTVDPGDTFTVNVVVVGDAGGEVFDIINFAPTFDSSILGLVGMTGMPTAGALTGLGFGGGVSGKALSIFGNFDVMPGDFLGTVASPPGGVAYKDPLGGGELWRGYWKWGQSRRSQYLV